MLRLCSAIALIATLAFAPSASALEFVDGPTPGCFICDLLQKKLSSDAKASVNTEKTAASLERAPGCDVATEADHGSDKVSVD